MLPAVRCPLCATPDARAWIEKRGFPLYRCRACGNAFLPGTVVPADLEDVYSTAYFDGRTVTGYPTYRADGPIIERNFARRLTWVASLRPPGRLLDVGAAYGFLLKVARAAGWEPTGVEIAADCAAVAARLSGAPVVTGDFLEVDLAGPYDVVTMFDVLEHMRDPVACVARARRLLAPDGLLVVETGDLGSPWARLLGRRWYFLDPPQHLSYFTAAGLTHFLERQGFRLAALHHLGRWVSLANIAFKLAHHAPGPFSDRLARARLPGAVYLNLGDAMVLAVRREE